MTRQISYMILGVGFCLGLAACQEEELAPAGGSFNITLRDAEAGQSLTRALPSALTELTETSVKHNGMPVRIPDFTRGAWNRVNGFSHAVAESK